MLWFAVVRLKQFHRTNVMARMANESGLRFSWRDPFEMPARYADFAVMNGGHSPRAYNVAYGMVSGAMLRGFDFNYEIGHGPRRMTVNHSILAYESETQMPFMAAWKFESFPQDKPAPLAAWCANSLANKWAYAGDGEILKQLLRHCGTLEKELVNIQCSHTTVMFVLSPRRNYLERLQDVSKIWNNFRHNIDAPGSNDEHPKS